MPPSATTRDILALAIPAFAALVAEPLFLLVDSAIIGHLGTVPLAGLGIAGTVLTTFVSMAIFLAYGTTASVAQLVGAGRRPQAIRTGVDGLWLALVIGVLVTLVLVPGAAWLVGLFDPSPAVGEQAVRYLRIGGLGATPMLLTLAATGVLRGLSDARTPLHVAVVTNTLNAVLNLVLVWGLGLGIAGSALGTVLAQSLGAAWIVLVVVRGARAAGASVGPSLAGVRAAGRAGVPLLLRTASLRASLLLMTYAATALGTVELATSQLALTIWGFLAFALDALAIAAQTLIGQLTGARDAATAAATTSRLIRWGAGFGVVTGLALSVLAPWLGYAFTSDPEILHLLPQILLLAALGQPLAGVVFVLDGVLIGAGEAPYLAVAGLVVLAIWAPAAWLAVSAGGSLAWLWAGFVGAFMGARGVALVARARALRPAPA